MWHLVVLLKVAFFMGFFPLGKLFLKKITDVWFVAIAFYDFENQMHVLATCHFQCMFISTDHFLTKQ